VGIPWTGSGAVGNAFFLLVREVSVRADMLKVIDDIVSLQIFDKILENCQETLR
jgi:hypothetical protein